MKTTRFGALAVATLAATALTFGTVSPAIAQDSANAVASETVSNPQITISENSLPDTGEHEITVTGTGFTNPSATPVRPPLAGKNGGVYVTASKFATEWKPSEGAPSTNRVTNRDNLKWFVPEESLETVGGAAAGAATLAEDGSFTYTITVSKEIADSVGFDGGNYGIYVYPGGGATVPEWEIFEPITFTETVEEPEDEDNLGGILGALLAVGGIIAALVVLFNAAITTGLLNPNLLPAPIRAALNI